MSGVPAGAAGTLYEEGLVDLDPLFPPPAQVAASMPLPGEAERLHGTDALARGREHALAGDLARAEWEFARAETVLPHLADWATLFAARAAAARRDSSTVRQRVAVLAGSGVEEWAWRPYFDVLRAAGDTAHALRIAEDAGSRAVTAAERSVAMARAGETLARRRDPRAIDVLRSAMRASPSTVGGLAAARTAHDLPGLTPEDRLLVGRTLLAHGGTERGIPLLQSYADAPEVSPAARAEVRLEIGRIHFNARRYEQAVNPLRLAAEELPEATFLLARSLYRQGRQDQGAETFITVGRRFPTSPFAADALFLLGDLAHDDGRTGAAAEFYRQTIATGAHNTSAADAAVRLAGILLMAADADGARIELDRYLSARPADRVSAPAIYWLGRAHLAAGRNADARSRFEQVVGLDPISYYGMLASERLGRSLADIPLPAAPSEAAHLPDVIAYRMLRIDVLREAGYAEESDLELARLRAELAPDDPALYDVAEALARSGQPIAAALLARDIQRARDAWDDRLLRIVYLFPHRDIIVRESLRNGLDPFLVAGLIRQESFFNPVAVSPAGAVGLMQVMPETGAGLARRVGVSFNQAILRDPDINARLGTLYLADQMGRWGGRASDVLGAYNAGPNRVARWRTFPEHRDDEIYTERIPIAETRDYIKRVRLNAEIYRRLYSGDL